MTRAPSPVAPRRRAWTAWLPRGLALLALGLLLVAQAAPAAAQQAPLRVMPNSLTGRILGMFPAYRAPAPHVGAAAAGGAMATQAGRAQADPQIAQDDLDTLRLLQLQAIGCTVGGIITSVAALATLTAATAVQGGAPLPFLGEIIAGFVTFFTGGCAVGALLIPAITLFDGGDDILIRPAD